MNLWHKFLHALRWLPNYGWLRLTRRPAGIRPLHLIFATADHFEPSILPGRPGEFAPLEEQERRLERWCREYPRVMASWRDADGKPFCHTYFYPAEQYEKGLMGRLAEHCHAGWGELEIQLHHGVASPDTAENTRRQLVRFRDVLVRHGCLSRWPGEDLPRYAFVHGNWALANSAGGQCCGVDEEMQILAETGCFADFTLPSAPNPAQVGKVNSIYECALPLRQRAPHRRGRDLERGRSPTVFPLVVQGPLALDFRRSRRLWPLPGIENSALTGLNPPTLERLRMWVREGIGVKERPDWVFVKLHCHGMDPRDESAMIGESRQRFLRDLTELAKGSKNYVLHFVTAREMVNIILAACDGREGNPNDYRNYRLRLSNPPHA